MCACAVTITVLTILYNVRYEDIHALFNQKCSSSNNHHKAQNVDISSARKIFNGYPVTLTVYKVLTASAFRINYA